jgi:hypothetical protein
MQVKVLIPYKFPVCPILGTSVLWLAASKVLEVYKIYKLTILLKFTSHDGGGVKINLENNKKKLNINYLKNNLLEQV